MSDRKETYIYESPDRGETVFARLPGSTKRIMISESDSVKSMKEEMRENQLWHNIRTAAKTNKALQKALDDAKIIYHLSNDDAK
jgi:hypothetical protein